MFSKTFLPFSIRKIMKTLPIVRFLHLFSKMRQFKHKQTNRWQTEVELIKIPKRNLYGTSLICSLITIILMSTQFIARSLWCLLSARLVGYAIHLDVAFLFQVKFVVVSILWNHSVLYRCFESLFIVLCSWMYCG